jgi:hypothetical protein
MFKKVQEGSRECSRRFKKMFKKVQEGSRRFKRMFKKVQNLTLTLILVLTLALTLILSLTLILILTLTPMLIWTILGGRVFEICWRLEGLRKVLGGVLEARILAAIEKSPSIPMR